MKQLLPTLREEFLEQLEVIEDSTQRQHPLTIINKKITVAIGMRRTGKTTMLLQEAKKQLGKGLSISQLLYINFEDDRLAPFTQDRLRQLIDAFYALYPDNHKKMCYLFFDEIQNIPDWSQVIRRIFDTKKAKIFLSGSSAKLLSTEIATELRGRCFTTEVWPYSFKECLITQDQHELLAKKSQSALDKLKKILEGYLKVGGFPEAIALPSSQRIKLLQDYVEIVVMRDIVERHHLSNIAVISYLIRFLLNNPATTFSVNKFFNDVKSQGYRVSKSSLYDYLHYIEDAYLAFFVPLFDESLRKVETNPKKIYTIDPGLSHAYSISQLDNQGRYFENCVYLDLRRQGCDIFYYLTKERYEVDFLAKWPNGELKLYQVVWDVEDHNTLKREERALEAAQQELGISGLLVTPREYFDLLDLDQLG